MGLLDHLWDDTVAGPRPENGLGKLRKHQSFSFRPIPSNDQSEGGSARSCGEDSPEEAVKVTRSIMIVKPPGYQGGSAPVSPAGSTPPLSPFSPPLSPFTGSPIYMVQSECVGFTNEKGPSWDVNGANAGGKEPFRFRRSTSDAFVKAAGGSETGPGSSSPTYGM